MTKEEIETAFETDFANPGSMKSGEYLSEQLRARSKKFIDRNKLELAEVLISWVQQRTEPKTMLAVEIAGELKLTELTAELNLLRDSIEKGECFFPFYLKRVDEALNSIKQ